MYAQKVTRFVSVVLIWEKKKKKSLNGGRTSPNLAIKLQSWEHRAPTFQYSMVLAKALNVN